MRPELPSAQNQFIAVLSRMPGDAALGGDAGLADRMPPAVGAALAATQRVIDRVHRLGPRVRADAHVTRAAGFSDADVDPIEIAELPDGGAALALHAAHFAGRQNDDAVLAFLRAQATDAAGAANQLPALPGIHLDVVNLQSARDVRQWQTVSQLRLSIRTAHHLGAD